MKCAICGKPATIISDIPGNYVSCDDHIEAIVVLNALNERVRGLEYERRAVSFDLQARHDKAWQTFCDLRDIYKSDD